MWTKIFLLTATTYKPPMWSGLNWKNPKTKEWHSNMDKQKNKTETCCICGKEIIGWGNNPAPVKTEGKCCDRCMATVVLPERINQSNRK